MEITERTPLAKGKSQDQLYEDLHRRATRDALSGLLNRATMEQYIRQRLQEMAQGDSCALFIIDLDNFKEVNDTLGHQAGDQAIYQSARILSGLFRPSDVVGRLGGDEFAVFLCGNITEDLVRKKGSTICGNLQLALGDHETIHLTASVGVHIADRGQKFEGLYQAADLALYTAKRSGKNRFCLRNEEGVPETSGGGFRPVNAIPLGRLLENMGSGLALVELGQIPKVIYVSPSFCRNIGADPQTYPLPQPLAELIHPDDLLSLTQTLQEAGRSGQMVEHTHRVRAQGEEGWLWWHIRGMQIEYQNPNPVVLVTTMDISQFKSSQQALEEVNQRFQAAFGQTYNLLWEVDLSAHTFSVFAADGETRLEEYDRKSFPNYLIDGGWIHPHAVLRFRTFAKKMLEGQSQGYGNFMIRRQSGGSYGWVTLSYRTLFDDVGRAVRAVGVLEDLPSGFTGRGGWTISQLPMPEGLVAGLIVYLRANLETDTVESLWVEGTDMSGRGKKSRCSTILQAEREKIFVWSDQADYLSNFNREQLLQSYREGKRWFAAEYQRVDSGGSIHWVQYILRLEEAPISHQVYLFLYLARVDARHALERAVRGNVQRDAVSQLYDQETIQRIAETLFAARNGGNRAVAVFQIRGLKESAQSAGVSPEQVRREIAVTLSLALGENGILGQYSTDQIVILFPDIAMQEELRRQIEEAVAFLRRVLFPGQACHALRFVTGVVMLSAAAANYRSMLVQAMHTCSLWLDSVSDTVAFAQESDDWGRLQMLPSEELDRVSVRTAEMARPLSEQEKDVAFDCVSSMLTARSLDDSLIGVLKTIGTYYHADRVYLLSLVKNQRAVVMNFEWTSPSKRSIQQAVSGRRLDRFPLLERCLAERAPVFLIRRNPDVPRKGDTPGRPWYFTAIPLIREQEVTGFLCIENAREHPADAALFSKLIPYLLLEKERFQEEPLVAGSVQHLMGSPDRRAYLRTVPTLTWEQFSSLGVVCLDVPGLIAINSSYGFEYSVHLLWYVAKTLTEIFPPSWIFRTGEAEFILFLPNTTREVFLGRCGRLRSILQRRYPRQIRIGRAWSDGKFLGKDLVKKAKGARQMEPAALPGNTWQPAAGGSTSLRAGKSQVMHSRFTVYLQPKINMRTGDLAGAEALVRGIGADGSIISPVQFIDIMEADGAIRDLDLLVLDRTLAQAEQWRADGLGTVPVSVNLSRVTVTHPSTLASVLAVQSRYPDFPPQALELEITERGDEIGNTEIQKIVEQFHNCALRLGLDDFGSQYANLPLFTTAKFDTVKLDKSLITDVVSNPINRTLVQDIIHICRTYGMACVAEGVETSAQVDALLDMGCIYAQGFYYDRPMPMEEFEWKYLRAGGPGAQNEQDKEEDT